MEINSPQQLLERIQSQIGQNVLKKVPVENEEYHLRVKQKAEAMGVYYEASKIGVDNLIQGYWDDIEMLDANEVNIIKEEKRRKKQLNQKKDKTYYQKDCVN